MQEFGPAARQRLALDADHIAAAFAGPVGQRILADLAVWHVYVDMSAGLKARQ